MQKGLMAVGLVSGQAFTLETRFAPPDPQAMRDGVQALLPNIDLLVVWGTIGGVAAKSVAPPIPVVFLSMPSSFYSSTALALSNGLLRASTTRCYRLTVTTLIQIASFLLAK